MKKLIFLSIIFGALQLACSDSTRNAPNQPRDIVFDDRLKITRNQQTGEYQTASLEIRNDKELKNSSKTLNDNSTLNTMFDGAGNKTETRFFDNHPLIKNVILRTSARGEKQIYIYAQNGDVKTSPEYLVEKALTASANELADAAGIFEQRKTRENNLTANKNSTPQLGILQPLPGYEFLPEIVNDENEKSEPVKTEKSKVKIKETEKETETIVPWVLFEESDKASNLK